MLPAPKSIFKVMKPPNDVHIVDYYVYNEDKVYHPAEKKHCPGCDRFKSWFFPFIKYYSRASYEKPKSWEK
jgi:hypothetical protein